MTRDRITSKSKRTRPESRLHDGDVDIIGVSYMGGDVVTIMTYLHAVLLVVVNRRAASVMANELIRQQDYRKIIIHT